MKRLFQAIILAALILAPLAAQADGLALQLSDSWGCSPVGMLSGMQYNISTKAFQRGVALGAGIGCRYTGWRVPLGIDAVGGASIVTNAPNSAEGSLIFTVADNYGIGPGLQVFKDPVSGSLDTQFLVSFFLTGSWAATIEQLTAAKQQAVQAERVRLQGAR